MTLLWFQSSTAAAAAIAAQTATKMERMRNAEQRLLDFARAYAQQQHRHDNGENLSLDIRTFDTHIPRSIVPLKTKKMDGIKDDEDNTSSLVVHGVHVRSKAAVDSAMTTATPLVLLHGYMNAGAYFYRNFGGLSRYFQDIYAIDMLGWGLSSRPSMDELDQDDDDGISKTSATTTTIATKQRRSIKTAEDFFVESLEAWRSAHSIEKMVLCGHSFGGYMSVAYTERYPERVERLVLLSPVGVPDESDPSVIERQKRLSSTWRGRIFGNVFRTVFENMTLGTVMRNYMSEGRSYGLARSYVTRRLPQISDPDESKAVADYLYCNSMLPGSGEFFVHHILHGMVMARSPLHFRIPNLCVDSVTFLYGQVDWMDVSGGLNTQATCEAINNGRSQRQRQCDQNEYRSHHHSDISDAEPAPDVKVYMVPNAGHLLMLENFEGTNNGIILASGGTISKTEEIPKLLTPAVIDDTDNRGNTNGLHRKERREEPVDERDQLLKVWLQKTSQSRKQSVPGTSIGTAN